MCSAVIFCTFMDRGPFWVRSDCLALSSHLCVSTSRANARPSPQPRPVLEPSSAPRADRPSIRSGGRARSFRARLTARPSARRCSQCLREWGLFSERPLSRCAAKQCCKRTHVNAECAPWSVCRRCPRQGGESASERVGGRVPPAELPRAASACPRAASFSDKAAVSSRFMLSSLSLSCNTGKRLRVQVGIVFSSLCRK